MKNRTNLLFVIALAAAACATLLYGAALAALGT
jgi:hypothetical protein